MRVQELFEKHINELIHNIRIHFLPSSEDNKTRYFTKDQRDVIRRIYTPYDQTNTLLMTTTIRNEHKGTQYKANMLFNNVGIIRYDDGETPDPKLIQLYTVNGKKFYIEPIQANKHDVEVSCSCPDFSYTFSKHNKRADCLYGPVFVYTPKGLRKSNNPAKVPGMCKHLMQATLYLKKRGVLIGAENI